MGNSVGAAYLSFSSKANSSEPKADSCYGEQFAKHSFPVVKSSDAVRLVGPSVSLGMVYAQVRDAYRAAGARLAAHPRRPHYADLCAHGIRQNPGCLSCLH